MTAEREAFLCSAEEVDRIELWAHNPDADCVQIVDFAVPDLIATVRSLRTQLVASREVVEAAELYVRADEQGQPWPAPAVSLRKALATYREAVEK